MVEAQHDKKYRQNPKHRRPRRSEAAEPLRQISGQPHQPALARERSQPVKRAAHADKRRLPVRGQRVQIKSVGRDVVRRRAKRHQPKHRERGLEKRRPRQRERDRRERPADHDLQRHDPKPFRAKQVHQRRPQRLDDPRQVAPARVERDVGIGDAEVLIHHHRQRHHDDIRDTLAKIERGNPSPRGALRSGGWGHSENPRWSAMSPSRFCLNPRLR